MRVILASGSPRRKELLEAAGVDFEVIPSAAEELYDCALGMVGLCEENARLKAAEVSQNHPEAVVIGADTLVFIDETPLGKPETMAEAAEMLRKLSGRVHQVCTGVCLAGPGEDFLTFHGRTEVTFRRLSDADIAEYLAMTNPLDKAGAYGIQDHGERIVESIAGAFDNVMGLPVALVLERLKEIELLIAQR